ncbi:MAG: PD-(D/E)XK nuclease family protein [Acidobacteria bacterium]|nr:PD-(D/E)XK nuclease family protein [Acidobacteriota bacterium]
MSYDPFDGVLLDDHRPPVSGAQGMLLHLRVARRQAKARGWPRPSLDSVRARAQACRHLLAHGLLPGTLRGLPGLDLGSPRAPHSLRNLADHLEAYLQEVTGAGCLEPDEALWRAVDLELAGRRGLWIERGPEDDPIRGGLRDLEPVRLRALACVPGLGGATFTLATRKGGATSGLFGGPLPLVGWFLDGLEQHGGDLPNELLLEEPPDWGENPWGAALEQLFEGPLPPSPGLRRGLVEGPVDLLRAALEQVCAWMDAGIAPQEITVVHPEPARAGAFLAPLLAAEGGSLHVRGALVPLAASEAWSPVWSLLSGLQRWDPCLVSGGLRASRREDLRAWADLLSLADQSGPKAFEASFMHLGERARASAEALWKDLLHLRGATLPAREWVERLGTLAGLLRPPREADDLYGPLGLLKEVWAGERWAFPDMVEALEAFLEVARSGAPDRAPEGLRLVAPGTLLDEWKGARATLLLDLSEGAWPARPEENPDLDWNRQAAINRALLERTRQEGPTSFPAALQRFWLPRAEHGDQVPRAFQREAYAFSKALALTREHLVALSPAQDAEGRTRAQGPFWHALEGVQEVGPSDPNTHSRLRWLWEGGEAEPLAEARAVAAQARPEPEALRAEAPAEDRVGGIREAWLKGRPAASPTALEGLARCPFRSLAERVWRLQVFDAPSRLRMAEGTLAHKLLEAALLPFVGVRDWPGALLASGGPTPEARLRGAWETHGAEWLADPRLEVPREQWPQLRLEVEGLLPKLAAALHEDAAAEAPTEEELALLFPETRTAPSSPRKKGAPPDPLKQGWTRTLLGLEQALGPVDLVLPGGRSLAVAGTVDRLERWEHPEGPMFHRITDYKTSTKRRLQAYAEAGAPFASHLQTPLYMLLAEDAHPGIPAAAALVPLREDEPKPVTRPLKTLAEAGGNGGWRTLLLENLERLDARLEAGDFPPTPGEHCQQCELGALCGRPVDVSVASEDGD